VFCVHIASNTEDFEESAAVTWAFLVEIRDSPKQKYFVGRTTLNTGPL
jgi:hypothetical protein